MKVFSLIALSFLLFGCGSAYNRHVIFLKEKDMLLVDLENNSCLESGYTTYHVQDGTYRLITYYSNCSVRKHRTLEEYELKQWGLIKK